MLKPLTRAAEQALGWGWTFGTLLLVVALGLIAARALPDPVGRRTSLLAALVAISLLMLSLPVRNALCLGQTSVIPVLLVLLGCFVVRGQRAGGALIGLAAALQPTVLLFAPLLWFTRRRQAAVSTAVTFAACTALAWAAMPRDSYTYWVHHMAGVGLGGRADALANQSVRGALLRLGLTGPLEIGLFLPLGAAVAVLGLRRPARGRRARRTGEATDSRTRHPLTSRNNKGPRWGTEGVPRGRQTRTGGIRWVRAGLVSRGPSC